MDHRILIADGHPVYVNKTIGFLRGLTFKDIQLVQTGAQAIDKVRSKKPDLVILSSMLEDMDSLDVCRTSARLAHGTTKIIVQIGLFTENEMIEEFKACGADIVLPRKEKDWQPLQKAIEELLFSRV